MYQVALVINVDGSHMIDSWQHFIEGLSCESVERS